MARKYDSAAPRLSALKNTRPTQHSAKVRSICQSRHRGCSVLTRSLLLTAANTGSNTLAPIRSAAWNSPQTTYFQAAPCQMPLMSHTTSMGKQLPSSSAPRVQPRFVQARRVFLTKAEVDTGKYT